MRKRVNLNLNKIDFTKGNGLIPAIIQDSASGQVLMLGYMNKESLSLTIKTKLVHFWSRSRNKLWLKGEKSGNKIKVRSVVSDCDMDSILIQGSLMGKAVCHTGKRSCFFNKLT